LMLSVTLGFLLSLFFPIAIRKEIVWQMACSVFRLRWTNARDALKCHMTARENEAIFGPLPEKRIPLTTTISPGASQSQS